MQRDGRRGNQPSPRTSRTERAGYRTEQEAPALSEQARERALRRRKHRKHVLIAFYLILFFVVLSAAAILSVTVLFKITDISVSGKTRYSQEQIIQASGIKIGDNLVLTKTKEDAQKIRAALPYIGSAKITRRFPTGISIEVEEAKIMGAAAYGSGYIIVGSDETVLETVSSPPDGYMTINGLNIKKAQAGARIQFADSMQENAFSSTLEAIQKSGISNITSSDFSQVSRILLNYDGRITINLGTATDLTYKLKFAKELLKTQIQSTETGTLNMSTAGDTDRAYFDPSTSAVSSSAAAKK
jgi:cell division protein FtsQ